MLEEYLVVSNDDRLLFLNSRQILRLLKGEDDIELPVIVIDAGSNLAEQVANGHSFSTIAPETAYLNCGNVIDLTLASEVISAKVEEGDSGNIMLTTTDIYDRATVFTVNVSQLDEAAMNLGLDTDSPLPKPFIAQAIEWTFSGGVNLIFMSSRYRVCNCGNMLLPGQYCRGCPSLGAVLNMEAAFDAAFPPDKRTVLIKDMEVFLAQSGPYPAPPQNIRQEAEKLLDALRLPGRYAAAGQIPVPAPYCGIAHVGVGVHDENGYPLEKESDLVIFPDGTVWAMVADSVDKLPLQEE